MKRDSIDRCTDHRFFCGQFFIWGPECKTVPEDDTGHEFCDEYSFGGWDLGRLYNRKVFSKTIALIAGALVLLGMGGYRMLRFFGGEKIQEKQEVGELDYFQGILLAVLLSLDGVAAGLGTGLAQARAGFLIPGVFLGGLLMMEAGWRAGNYFQHIFQRDISWISGICLMVLGVGTLCKL